MKMCELIPKNAILPAIQSEDKRGVVKELVTLMKEVHDPPAFKPAEVVEALLKRERLGTTGMGNGVAVPHAKLEGVGDLMGAFGRCPKGVDFNAIDGEPVHLVFLIVSPFEKADAHVKALQTISLAVRRPNFVKFLRQAKSVKEIVDLFHEVDEAVKV